MIVADTGAILALIDRAQRQHEPLRRVYEETWEEWVLPWAILPEVDYFVARMGRAVAEAFRADLAEGTFPVEWGETRDLVRARELDARYGELRLGLVDAVVMAVAERLEARAIATLDERDFGPVVLQRPVALWPRDL